MDGDEDLQAAVLAGAAFALVRVAAIAREKAGTRGQVVGYRCQVLRALEKPWPTALTLKHYGLPLLEAGHCYVVGALDNRRHHGGWEIRFAAGVEGPADDAVSTFLARRKRIAPMGS